MTTWDKERLSNPETLFRGHAPDEGLFDDAGKLTKRSNWTAEERQSLKFSRCQENTKSESRTESESRSKSRTSMLRSNMRGVLGRVTMKRKVSGVEWPGWL